MKMDISKNLSKALLITMLIMLLSSCRKDNELQMTGNLVVTFKDYQYLSQTDLPKVYVLENTFNPLIDKISVDSNGVLRVQDLNYGNYYLGFTTQRDGNYFGHLQIFQIKVGKTTELTIDL